MAKRIKYLILSHTIFSPHFDYILFFVCFQASPERACLTPISPSDPSAQYFEGQYLSRSV